MERNIIILIVIVLVIWLVITFWKIALTIFGVGFGIRLLYLYICDRVFCFHCGGTGVLNKFDTSLNLNLRNDEPCYMCSGHGIPTQETRRLHKIARDATNRMVQLEKEEEVIQSERNRLRKMQFSDRTSEEIAFSYNKMLTKKNKQLESLDVERQAYEEAKQFAHTSLYNLSLVKKMQEEQHLINRWDAKRTDVLEKGADVLEDSKFQHQHDLPLLASPELNYLELVSEPMKRNIEKATIELRQMTRKQ